MKTSSFPSAILQSKSGMKSEVLWVSIYPFGSLKWFSLPGSSQSPTLNDLDQTNIRLPFPFLYICLWNARSQSNVYTRRSIAFSRSSYFFSLISISRGIMLSNQINIFLITLDIFSSSLSRFRCKTSDGECGTRSIAKGGMRILKKNGRRRRRRRIEGARDFVVVFYLVIL